MRILNLHVSGVLRNFSRWVAEDTKMIISYPINKKKTIDSIIDTGYNIPHTPPP